MKMAIIIAAHNEEESIHSVISTLPVKMEGISEIIPVIVDDGSNDNTEAIARSVKGVHVLKHLINRGQGAALKTGFAYALKQECDVVVTFDADGQHNPKEIVKVVTPIIAGEAKVVLGSRFLLKRSVENMSPIRKVVLFGAVQFTRVFSRIKVTDTHNGFRAIHRDALVRIKLVQDKMEHASEIIDQISRQKIPFVEVPVTITYSNYSKSKGQRDGNAFKIAMKMIFHKLIQ